MRPTGRWPWIRPMSGRTGWPATRWSTWATTTTRCARRTRRARLAPTYWQAHVCLAQAALAAQRLPTAADAAARARALAPDEPDVHFLSGKVSLARGDLAGAREHQERALALDPAHSGAMNELGRIRLRRNDPVGAIRHFLSAARATPDELIYARNIDVVILRTVSRTIYVFTLIALILIWVPAVTHVSRLPFAIGIGSLAVVDRGGLRLGGAAAAARGSPAGAPDAARRPGSRRRSHWPWAGSRRRSASSRSRPGSTWPQMLPIAVVITVVARLASFAALRAAARKNK